MKMEQATKENMVAMLKELNFNVNDAGLISANCGKIIKCPVCKTVITKFNIGGMWKQKNDTIIVCGSQGCQIIAVIELIAEEDVEGF